MSQTTNTIRQKFSECFFFFLIETFEENFILYTYAYFENALNFIEYICVTNNFRMVSMRDTPKRYGFRLDIHMEKISKFHHSPCHVDFTITF